MKKIGFFLTLHRKSFLFMLSVVSHMGSAVSVLTYLCCIVYLVSQFQEQMKEMPRDYCTREPVWGQLHPASSRVQDDLYPRGILRLLPSC